MRFAAIYANGAVMGFTPQQVNEMSMWQFLAAVDGYVKANSAEDTGGLSESEKDDIAGWLGI